VGGIIRVRAFKPGDFVRVKEDGPAYVYEDSGSHEEKRSYQVVFCERDEERCCSASELTKPKAGDRVAVRNCEDDEAGEFLHAYGEGTSVVKWKSFPLPQIWSNTNLEPAFTE
jgi:hypothetical protein